MLSYPIMARAQGSLEYLVIISVALAITVVVTLIVVNSFGSQQNRYVYNTCANAAASCKTSLSANPASECSFCDTSCNFTNGTAIFPRATYCCKQGKSEMIYDGSGGCTRACKDGTPYDECSTTQPPKYCDEGTIVDKCTPCGCPGGEACNADGTCSKPSTCGTVPEGQCSPTLLPLRCENSRLVARCDLCGCPDPTPLHACCEDAKTACMCQTVYTCLSGSTKCSSRTEYSPSCTSCGTTQCCYGGYCQSGTACRD